jgi:motility quorum-sensing regulator/GCU-specific mRNA interferase toxin
MSFNYTFYYTLPNRVCKPLIYRDINSECCVDKSASDNAGLMGLDRKATVSVVLSLQRDMLFKSMTTRADHRVWQDVYHAPCPNGKTAYIKVTIQVGAIVIQFKEK